MPVFISTTYYWIISFLYASVFVHQFTRVLFFSFSFCFYFLFRMYLPFPAKTMRMDKSKEADKIKYGTLEHSGEYTFLLNSAWNWGKIILR